MQLKPKKLFVISAFISLFASTFMSTTILASPNKLTPVCEWTKFHLVNGKRGNFKGWQVYSPAIECTATQLAKDTANTKTIEGTLVKFFGALMHQRKSFKTMLSPTMHPIFREILEKKLLNGTKTLHRFIIHAQVSSSISLDKVDHSGRRFLKMGKVIFGSFDSFVFMEGNTSRDDIFIFLEKKEKRWYIKGFLANSLSRLFKGVKPWWKSKKNQQPTSKKVHK